MTEHLPSSTRRTAAVIGAGFAGLTAAKHLLAVGIQPRIFDKCPEIGGMWNPNTHPSWNSLKTNISRFTVCYTDLPWPSTAPVFPTQKHVYEYLKSYCDKFISDDCLQLNTTVTSVRQQTGSIDSTCTKKWIVSWTNEEDRTRSKHEEVEYFDCIIVATGFFSARHIPSIPMQDFNGLRIHSEEYRSPELFRGKRVVVVGSSFSSAEICSELCVHAKEVVNIVSTRFWAIPRFIPASPDDPASPFLPVDVVFYKRTGRKSFEEAIIKSAVEYREANMYFSKACGHATFGNQEYEPAEDHELPFVAISDDFLPCVRSGQIKIQRGRVKSAFGSCVTLEDGSTVSDVDAIIFATGFRPKFPFLPADILEAASFMPNDPFSPVLLHGAVFCPNVPDLAFVGMYRGSYFLVVELQAMWAAKVFSSNQPLSDAEIQEGMVVESKIRNQRPRPQFPHADYVGFASSLAKHAGVSARDESGTFFMPTDFCIDLQTFTTYTKEVNEKVEEYMAGKMVAGAVFRALVGTWTMRYQEFDVEHKSTMSACMVDTELKISYFHTARGVDYEEKPVQFLESRIEVSTLSQCKTSDHRTTTFVQAWKYDHAHDELSVKLENNSEYFSVRILPPSSTWPDELQHFSDIAPVLTALGEKGWKAVAEYQNHEDKRTHTLYFLFRFTGILLSRIDLISTIGTNDSVQTSSPNVISLTSFTL